jgi:hypothetical protein
MKMESWLDKQVSYYESYNDNVGEPATFRELLFSEFWKDLDTLSRIHGLARESADYKKDKTALKGKLHCYTPAALLETKAHGKLREIERTGIMQLDFDSTDNGDYDVEELKACVFNLPFIGFCGLSASGDGFYALAKIAEPNRLSDYAEHCFQVFEAYGIKPDKSKGRKVENLRYLSYDPKMLIRDYPETLRIPQNKRITAPRKKYKPILKKSLSANSALIKQCLGKIEMAQVGQRWMTVQQVAYTLGGLGNDDLLEVLVAEINNNPAFAGEEEKYCKCAEDCFGAGTLKPLL